MEAKESFIPYVGKIIDIRQETPDVKTFSVVGLDGKKLFEHHCGYTAFRVELTEALRPGRDALLVIRVDSRETLDQPPFGFVVDYMTYGGLYREVWLEIREKSFVEDVFVRPEVPDWVCALSAPAEARFEGTRA